MFGNTSLFNIDLDKFQGWLANLLTPIIHQAVEQALAKYSNEEDPDDLLTSDQVAQMFDVTTVTLYKWRKAGRIPHHRLNGSRRVYYKRHELQDALKSMQRGKGRNRRR